MTRDLAQEKRAMRRELRKRRQAFVREHGAMSWSPPTHCLANLADSLQPGLIIATYNRMGSEADPAPFAAIARAAGAILAWPRVDTAMTMRFFALGPSMQFAPDAAGIAAPAADGILAVPDVILLPLLGFDRRGTRLGQGAGYYDRTISELDEARPDTQPRARRIGIAWSVQEVDSLPRDHWDMALDAIATEREWIIP